MKDVGRERVPYEWSGDHVPSIPYRTEMKEFVRLLLETFLNRVSIHLSNLLQYYME